MPRERKDSGKVVDLAAERSAASARARRQETNRKRAEAASLVLAGVPYETIADRLGIGLEGVRDLVRRTFAAAPGRAEQAGELRAIECARLDRAQAAIWPQVLAGDLPAVDVWLRLSARRSRLMGLDEPTRIHLAVNVRAQMEQALSELEAVVLGEVVRGELPAAAD